MGGGVLGLNLIFWKKWTKNFLFSWIFLISLTKNFLLHITR
jgi:hypothetical protein